MIQRHLWLGTAVIALLTLSSPASAQYVSRYESSDGPNVEVNLDILNDRAEKEYKAQHDVAAEPLAPAPVLSPPVPPVQPVTVQQSAPPAPVPAVTAAAAMPETRQKRRLLKPVFTAGTPSTQTAPQLSAPEPQYDVSHAELPPSDPSELMPDAEMEANLAAEEAVATPPAAQPARMASLPLPRHKPAGTKRSWSPIDGTPAPAYLDEAPQPPVVMASAEVPVAHSTELKADEEAATPPVMMAQADIPAPVAATTAPEAERAPIISRRPRLSDEAPSHVPAQPLVTQAYPTTPITSAKPALSNDAQITPPPVMTPVTPKVAEPDDDWSAPVPSRPAAKKPEAKRPSLIITQGDDNAPSPLPEVTAPVARQNEPPLTVPPAAEAPQPDLSQLPPPDATAMDAPEPTLNTPESLPVVPTLADLTLGFPGNTSDLTSESQHKLDAVISQLNDNTDGRLQVRGYASGDGSTATARRIALSRVLAVRSYLMDKGIKPARVDVHARGAVSDGDTRDADRVDLIFAR